MGLYLQQFDFGTESQVPDPSEVSSEAISRLGSDAAIEGIEVRGAVVEVRTMMDHFAHLVLPAILMERGGRPPRHRRRPHHPRGPRLGAWAAE